MKIICSTQKLSKATQIIQKALPTKTVSPILTGIYIKAKDDKIELQATDYEIAIVLSIEAQVIEEGTAILPGNYFTNLLKRLSGETVEITKNKEDNKLTVSSGVYETDLLSMAAEDYPVINKLAVSNFINLKDDVLKDLIKKTVFACSNDESRPIFTGALFSINSKEVSFVATNTHRMALRKYTLEKDNGNFSMVIPAKVLKEIERINAGDLPEEVMISWKNRQMAIIMNDIYIESRLLEGNFPDYNKVIPEAFSKNATFKTSDLLGAVERVSLLFKEGEYNVLRLSIDNGKIVITSNNPEMGKAKEVINCENEGGNIEIAFNSRYLTDILRNIDEDEAVIKLNSSISPACIRPKNDENYTYIVTPIRVAY